MAAAEVNSGAQLLEVPACHHFIQLTAAGQRVVVEVQAILDPGWQDLKLVQGQGFDAVGGNIQQPESLQPAPLLHQLQGEA